MNEDHRLLRDDDDVATLIRLAGRSHAVPREIEERARAAARAQWRYELRRHARNSVLWGATGLAAAAMLVVVFWLGMSGPGTMPGSGIPVQAVSGMAWSFETDAGERRALDVGDDVTLGSVVETAEGSRSAIRLASGHSVRLDESTRIRVVDSGSVTLDWGAVYVDSGLHHAPGSSMDVHTPFGRIQSLGTQFEIRLREDSVRVRLREGAVMVHHGKDSHEVRAGTELEMALDGSVTRNTLSAHGPEWDWIVGITPMIDLEGLTAHEFLAWVARERGWKLAFADAAVARASEEIVLGGRAERLTSSEALDAVLPTCRMTYDIEDGVLLIAASR